MSNDYNEQEIKKILSDPKFQPYLNEYLYRKNNIENTIQNLKNNFILFNHQESKDIIYCDSDDTVNHVLIESENLYALAALSLLPREHKFDVLLIDPLYGTQSGKFRYNDKTVDKNNPRGMLEWSMAIENRLKLAKRILRPDGIIMAFINYENCHLLRNCMDKVFGRENIIAQRPWRKKATPGNKTNGYLDHVDFICVYAYDKGNLKDYFQIPKSETILRRFKYDNHDDRGPYELTPFEKSGNKGDDRPSKYTIYDPDEEPQTPEKQWWRWCEEKYDRDKDDFIEWKRVKKKWVPYVRGYLMGEDGAEKMTTPSCIIDMKNIQALIESPGTLNTDGNKEASNLLNGKNIADMNPKPPKVIKKILGEIHKKDIRVCDFYGGLGTTMQAVIELNHMDGQKRVCYCIQNEEGMSDGNRIIDDAHLRIKNLMSRLNDQECDMFAKIKQNVRYFITKLEPIDFSAITPGKKLHIFQLSESILKLVNESYNLIEDRDGYKILSSGKRVIILINEKWDNTYEEKKQIIADFETHSLLDKKTIVYEWSLDTQCKINDIGEQIYAIPHAIEVVQKRAFTMLK